MSTALVQQTITNLQFLDDEGTKATLIVLYNQTSEQADVIIAQAHKEIEAAKADAPKNGHATKEQIVEAATIEQTEEKTVVAAASAPEVDLATADPEELGLDIIGSEDDARLNDAIMEAKHKVGALAPVVDPESLASPIVQPDTNGEFPTPVDGALWMGSIGIPQTPLQKGTKKPFLPAWEQNATLDPEQIRAWAAEYPGCNFGSVAKSGAHFVFEADSPNVKKRFEATGGVFSSGLIIQSRDGRGHRWYLYADGVKNISQAYTEHGDFSLRADDQQCVSPGSIHPDTKKQYRVVAAGAPAVPTVQEVAFWNSERVEKKSAQHAADIPRDEKGLIQNGDGRVHGFMLHHAGRFRQLGLKGEAIKAALYDLVAKNCAGPIDWKKVDAMAHSICKYQEGQGTGEIIFTQPTAQQQTADVSNWHNMFRSVEEMEDGPIVMVIESVLQEGTCFMGANPGDGKTLLGLAFAKAISTGEPLFGLGQYSVPQVRTVIYLIPETRDRAFRKRCEAFRMPKDKMKFMARTISAGVPLELGDPYLLEAVRETKPVVFLDTASRFMKSADENAAAQNRQLVNDVITLLAAGAVCVVLIHHATKASRQEAMSLENMLRGSSDLGAMCDQAYGIRKDMSLYDYGSGPMEIDLVSLKDREQIGGLTNLRLAASYKKDGMDYPGSYINETGNFRVVSSSETWKRDIDALLAFIKSDPNVSEKTLAEKTGLSVYTVGLNLKQLGWHRVQGGKGGASPWHQDAASKCPYTKPTEDKKGAATKQVAEAVKYLRDLLRGTKPDGEYIAESEVYQGADKLGLPDAAIAKARKRLDIIIANKQWSLPAETEDQETVNQ